jgi:hypothetical protein
MELNYTYCSVSEAIEEISILNPTYKKILINPYSFLNFVKQLGSIDIFLFGKWSKKHDSFTFDNFKIRIKIYPDKKVAPETALFMKKNSTITVKLSV